MPFQAVRSCYQRPGRAQAAACVILLLAGEGERSLRGLKGPVQTPSRQRHLAQDADGWETDSLGSFLQRRACAGQAAAGAILLPHRSPDNGNAAPVMRFGAAWPALV